MIVDTEDPTRNFYTPSEHAKMDVEVKKKLDALQLQWKERPSRVELIAVFHRVVKGDHRLDQRLLDYEKFPTHLEVLIWDAWQAMAFEKIRIRCDLQLPETKGGCAYIGYPTSMLAALGKAMSQEYKGMSANAFIEYLTCNNIAFNLPGGPSYYARFCSMTQSSGVGKTRLMFELGRKGVCVLYINIRTDNQGYPPCDSIPASILTQTGLKVDQYHQQYRIFFAAVFTCLAHFLKTPTPFQVLSDVNDSRRTEFLNNVGKEFAIIEQEVSWSPDQASINVMLERYKALTVQLKNKDSNQPKVVIAIDEAHVLYEKLPNQGYHPAMALLQTIREYSAEDAVWVVFVSTAPQIAHFSSIQAMSPLSKALLKGELLFPPFTQLGWDHYAPALNKLELDKVAWASHIIQYGRPLWWSQKEYMPLEKMITFAGQKLCLSRTFNPSDQHQAFAVLGQRFGLDIAFGHQHAAEYNETFITSHLRICIRTTEDCVWSYTIYPSEPILSVAAAGLLYAKEKNLLKALTQLSWMVNVGLINIGDAGELASRFLWLLAKDLCVQQSFVVPSSFPSSNNAIHGDFEVPFCQLVPVISFLKVVFGQKFKPSKNVQKVFGDAYINFSHWIKMKFNITRGDGGRNDISIEDWTKSLWAHTSAVQCCHDQPVIDKVIPMLFKPQSGPSRLSHIIISDMARESAQPNLLDDITRYHQNITSHWDGPAYIAILADLGAPSSEIIIKDSSSSNQDPCLRIHVTGLTQDTYPFLDEDIITILKDFSRRPPVPSNPKYLEDLEAEVQFGRSRELCYTSWKE